MRVRSTNAATYLLPSSGYASGCVCDLLMLNTAHVSYDAIVILFSCPIHNSCALSPAPFFETQIRGHPTCAPAPAPLHHGALSFFMARRVQRLIPYSPRVKLCSHKLGGVYMPFL